MSSNKVLTITTENFESAVINSDKPVLIDFWASWCGPCRMISPTVEALADEMAGKINVAKVNVDEQQEIAEAFKIMSIPTLVMTQGNKVIMQSVGVKTKEALKREITAAICA